MAATFTPGDRVVLRAHAARRFEDVGADRAGTVTDLPSSDQRIVNVSWDGIAGTRDHAPTNLRAARPAGSNAPVPDGGQHSAGGTSAEPAGSGPAPAGTDPPAADPAPQAPADTAARNRDGLRERLTAAHEAGDHEHRGRGLIHCPLCPAYTDASAATA